MTCSKNVFNIIVLATVGIVVIVMTLPTKEMSVQYEQTSPGQLDDRQYKENRDTAPLSVNGSILQRIWLADTDIVQLMFFLRPKEDLQQPPVLRLRRDEGGEPSEPLTTVDGWISGSGQHTAVIYNIGELNLAPNQWIWAEFTQEFSPLAIRFYRNIDGQQYPGGRLIINDPPRHQEQGVLSFRLQREALHWPSSKRIMITALVALAFLLAQSQPLKYKTPAQNS